MCVSHGDAAAPHRHRSRVFDRTCFRNTRVATRAESSQSCRHSVQRAACMFVASRCPSAVQQGSPRRQCCKPVRMLHTVMGLNPLQTNAAHLRPTGLCSFDSRSVVYKQRNKLLLAPGRKGRVLHPKELEHTQALLSVWSCGQPSVVLEKLVLACKLLRRCNRRTARSGCRRSLHRPAHDAV